MSADLTRRPRRRVQHHLVSSESVATWIGEFCSSPSQIVCVPDAASVGDVVALVAGLPRQEGVALHSSHRSLQRDAVVGAAIRGELGRDIFVQTEAAAAAGADKAIVRSKLERCGIPHTSRVSEEGSTGPVIIKRRAGTEGRDMRLEWGKAPPAPSEVAEQFVFGEEFSVNLFIDLPTCVTLPPVWKGPTRLDLVPPWRRARICPYPRIRPAVDRELRALAVAAANACGAIGFVEVEFVVESATGHTLVLEVNPRISGTLRMSAMASGVKLLDLFDLGGQADLEVRAVAIEVPYTGVTFCDLQGGVIATSRLTVAADDMLAAEKRLLEISGAHA